jgi:thiol-disulfide isomerase/thioredoxin
MARAAIPPFQGTLDEFTQFLTAADGPVVAVFHGQWCGTCRRLLQLLPSVAKDFPQVQFIAVDVDQSKTIATHVGVQVVPQAKIVTADGAEIVVKQSIVGANIQTMRKAVQEAFRVQ